MEQKEAKIFGMKIATGIGSKGNYGSDFLSGIPFRLRLLAAGVLTYQSFRHPSTDGYLELDTRNNSVTVVNRLKARDLRGGQ